MSLRVAALLLLTGCCAAPAPVEVVAMPPALVGSGPPFAAVPHPRTKPEPPAEPAEPAPEPVPAVPMTPPVDQPAPPPAPDVGWLVGEPADFLLANLGQPETRHDGWFVASWTYNIEGGKYCLALRRDRETYKMMVASVEPAACPA